MGMPKGLSKATNYYNNLEAWRDWHKLANEVEQAGYHDLVVKHTPLETFGWRKVDKAIAALREAFQQMRALDVWWASASRTVFPLPPPYAGNASRSAQVKNGRI